jgi:hypothetical protein
MVVVVIVVVVATTVLLYNIYIIYISVKSLSHFKPFKDIFLNFFYQVFSITNLKNIFVKGVYKGPLLGTLSHEPKFK